MSYSLTDVSGALEHCLRENTSLRSAEIQRMVRALPHRMVPFCPAQPQEAALLGTTLRDALGPAPEKALRKCLDHVTPGRPRMSEFDFIRCLNLLWAFLKLQAGTNTWREPVGTAVTGGRG